MTTNAGRFDFEDGGAYCGGWEDGKAHGHGVCTGPKGMGEFSGVWQFGYEVSGIYIWPSSDCFQGQWMSGKRHGLGVEKKERWIYKGEWAQGFKGRYGVRVSETSGAKYEGTWANGLQDGYGAETYADTGTYYGQMAQGMRNGYGIRKSVTYGAASRYRSKDIKNSLTSLRSEQDDERTQRERDRKFDENRGGFVLRARSDPTEDGTANNSNHGGIVTTALSGLLKGRRNSFGHSQERRISLRKTIMSKFTKQKSVNDIDDVNGPRAASAGRNANKKSSFRSTSSNNSVDSRTSNRTAPPGVGGGVRAVSTPAGGGQMDDGEYSFISQDEITDVNCIEIYMGEWKQDKRTGYGIAERSDGLKYEGEWFNNKKNGYGVTTFKDGTKEEGKYKNNVLIVDKKKGKLTLLRTSKNRERIDFAVNTALKAAQIAQQRADIAIARAKNARAKAEAAELAAKQARMDSEIARLRAHEVAPDFIQPGELKKMREIFLEIDKYGISHGINDIPSNNISPMPYRRPNLQPQQSQQNQTNYMPQQQYYITSTPPVLRAQSIGLKPNNTFINDHIDAQYYSSNQHQQDMHKPINEILGMNPLDQQSAAQMHMQLPTYIHTSAGTQLINPNQYNPYLQHPQHGYISGNISFDDTTMDNNNNNNIKNTLMHQHQHQSFIYNNNNINNNNNNNNNVDIYNNNNNNNNIINNNSQNNSSFDEPIINSNFQRNNPKRNTLKRSQRVMDNSNEDISNNHNNHNNINNNSPNNLNQKNQNNAADNKNNDNSNYKNENYLRAPSVPRRKSLPSIVKNQAFKEDEIAHSSSELNNKNQETFIIENGIRKRITEKSNPSLLHANNILQQNTGQLVNINNNCINNNNNNSINNNNSNNNNKNKSGLHRLSSDYSDDTSPKLPRKIIIESITSLNAPESKLSSKRVSMPSINALLSPKFANKVMSREEANRLSSLQREHNRKYGKDGQNTNNLAKLKQMFPDCLNRHRLFLAIIIFNISLAIWFFQLLK